MGPRNDDIRTELAAAINLQAFNSVHIAPMVSG
jgi:hypothetical protein